MEVIMKYKLTIGKILKHFHLVNKHRFIVFKLSIRAGIPLQGLVHDLSKYSFVEFFESARYYAGTYSPIKNAKEDKGYSEAWLHHKGRNKHHWQYWITVRKGVITPNEMPIKYIKEMACDRIAACMTYEKEKYHNSSALEFLLGSAESRVMPPETVEILKKYLTVVAENDLDKALAIIKEMDK
jgi:hypothetical protein